MMQRIQLLRWSGLSLLLGTIIYAVASIIAEPFEQETATSLYQMIGQEVAQYRLVNALSLIGMILLLAGFYLLTRLMPEANRRLVTLGLALFGVATALWAAEVIGRLTITTSAAQEVNAGGAAPTAFPQTIGVGLEPLFLAFLLTALAGIALLVWLAGDVGLVNRLLARVGAALTIVGGIVAAITYPWVGGIERALFYPLVIVVLPLAVVLLIRGFRQPRAVVPVG